jgi:hypothetical protein
MNEVAAPTAPTAPAGPSLDQGAPDVAQRAVLAVAVVVGVVLRWWDLGGPVATFDESFTGAYSHLPLGRIPSALRAQDAHPPLDYLIRHLFGSMGDTFALRVPSAVFGCLTLVVVVWWMWRRGWFGVAVVVLTSLSPFQLLYAHEARMYALAILCGTGAAAVTDRWRRDGSPRWRWLMALAVLVGLFDLSSFLLYAGALLLVPGRRRDGEAWRWRATVAGCLGLWAVVWGPSFADQAQRQHSGWIPLTSVAGIRDTIAWFSSQYASVALISLLAVAAVAAGAVLLYRQDRGLGEVWLWLVLLPFGAACLIGLRSHFLLTRTLAASAWGVPVAMAALFERARRYSVVAAAIVVVLVAIVVGQSIGPSLSYQEGAGPGVQAVAGHVQPGDAVLVYPSWLWPLVVWSDGAARTQDVPAALSHLATGAWIYVKPGAPFDGRVWIFEPTVYSSPTAGLRRCPGRTPVGGNFALTCYQVTSG